MQCRIIATAKHVRIIITIEIPDLSDPLFYSVKMQNDIKRGNTAIITMHILKVDAMSRRNVTEQSCYRYRRVTFSNVVFYA